jgi:acetyl/propionyl-CoA carboxylase alpha subunit
MRQALRDFVILGLHTNASYLLRVLSHPDVAAGAIHTGWLAAHHDALVAPPPADIVDAAALVVARHRRLSPDRQRGAAAAPASATGPDRTPWDTIGGWRG